MMLSSAWFTLPLLSLSSFVHSFPTSDNFAKLKASPEQLHRALIEIRDKRLLISTGKPVDVSGKHAFQPPNFDAGDQRGPCPGLNALANHGYLPRDGIASMSKMMHRYSSRTVYGMGIDLGTLIGVMGTVYSGNPLSLDPGFSIGGESSKVSNILGNVLGLLGTPRGLDAAHNFIEADASNTRDDLYVTGDAATMNMTLFMDIYNSMGDVLTFDDVGARIAKRFEESKASNPHFYSGPYTGMIGRNAGYAFTTRLLSNHSAEHPLGQMTKNVLKSFWAVYEDSKQPSGLVYKRGQEQIPSNWYRIPVDYSLVQLNVDLLQWYLKYPATLSIGGNMGKVNSFVGVDFDDITGGVLNSATILEGNGLICFVLEVVKTFAPNSLATIFKTLATPLELITDTIAAPILSLACPEFEDLQTGGTDLWTKLVSFSGAAKAGSAL
ncbi:Cloroperoxidase [Lophium mytilinum]|uniref:Cloroperoxidase n=1 Tax=Lophium mytilinum TaxID=390894 RepID=A0A6A6R2N8_9PEZI|nr:Cloroperoxidase [Lophium mytilinum]